MDRKYLDVSGLHASVFVFQLQLTAAPMAWVSLVLRVEPPAHQLPFGPLPLRL
jgi:hypothetical protein